MRVLIIKTSSLGDVIHTLPALTDAGKAIPSIQFDWVVEDSFAEIPYWHPLVKNVIPVAIRRWRKKPFSAQTRVEFRDFCRMLRAEKYDFIIDAQGLLKTVWLSWVAKGIRCGMNWQSAREPLVSIFYQRKYAVGELRTAHAVERNRKLFSQVLGYHPSVQQPEYGVILPQQVQKAENGYILFLHGTTWPTKHWPEDHWIELAKLVNQKQLPIKLPWGNQQELARAQRIAAHCQQVEILPRMNLTEISSVLANAKAIVAVDTGLGHLAAALNVPTVSLYGPTDATLTGTCGKSQVHLAVNFSCAPCLSKQCTYRGLVQTQPPCFSTLPASMVWKALETLL